MISSRAFLLLAPAYGTPFTSLTPLSDFLIRAFVYFVTCKRQTVVGLPLPSALNVSLLARPKRSS